MPDPDPRDPLAPPAEVLENEIDGTGQHFGGLTNPPYRNVAKANPRVVRARHPGIALKGPDRAGCLIEIEQSAERTPPKRKTDVRA